MKVLHLNVRAAQGGAGKVMIDLHRRMQRDGLESTAAYGYGSGITDDPVVAHEENIVRLGTRPGVLTNYAAHLVIGRELFTCNRSLLRNLIEQSDLVHLHCPHHYYLSWPDFITMLHETDRPVVATAHDWWFLSGRCGFTDGCDEWQRHCGKCGARRKGDLPSIFDFSRRHQQKKIASITALGRRFHFVCPSEHLAQDYRRVFHANPVHIAQNFLDLEFEEAMAHQAISASNHAYLISASDLSYPGKVDPQLIAELGSRNVEVRAMGRNNPFSGPGFQYLGEIRSRAAVLDQLSSAKGLLFCSRVDNAPLTIIEALAAGCPVLAYQSPAAQEMLAAVGGRCVSGLEEMLETITSDSVASLYGGISRAELASRASKVFSGSSATSKYKNIYSKVLACQMA